MTPENAAVLNDIYKKYQEGQYDADKMACMVMLRLLRWCPSVKPMKIVLPILDDEAVKVLARHIDRIEHVPIKLVKGLDSLGNNLYTRV